MLGLSLVLLATEVDRCLPLSEERFEGDSDRTESVSGSESGETFVDNRKSPV
jgi:hypothetical protein